MKLAFISYWGIDQGLTQATVIPHLAVLDRLLAVESIHFITIERTSDSIDKDHSLPDKVVHIPVFEAAKSNFGSNKITTLRKVYKKLKEVSPDIIFARSSLAAIPAYFYNRKTKVPYVVESFEPHANYMVDSNEWSAGGLKYKMLKKWEEKQIKTANFLLPVAENYKEELASRVINPEKIKVLPCTVDVDVFQKDIGQRSRIRKELGIDDQTVVGIYVGKFGGLYQEEEAFGTFHQALSRLGNYHLIVLSPTKKEAILKLAEKTEFEISQLSILEVKSHEVPSYLSASDIAFATYKRFSSNKYLSPIKLGEYFANGLFVVCTPNVGDDANRLASYEIGITTDQLPHIDTFYKKHEASKSVEYARQFRGRKIIAEVYTEVIESLS